MSGKSHFRELVHDFANAVNGINVSTQSFAVAVKVVGIDKVLSTLDCSPKEKITKIFEQVRAKGSGLEIRKDLTKYSSFVE